MKSGRPSEWKTINEKSSNWSKEEENLFLGVLSRLPDEIKKIPFDGFYPMQKSNTVTNPASTSESGKVIVIYDRTFKNPFWTAEDVILHELGHVIFLNMSKKEQRSYKNKLGWKNVSGRDMARDDGFVSSRAKDSPHEDFAENFSFFLKDSALLKSKAPTAYEWLIKRYKIDFKLKKGCPHEKK